MKRYLLRAYGERHQMTLEGGEKVPTTPGRQAVSEALDQLEAVAHGGTRRAAPALRVAGDVGPVVVDLCRDDYAVVVVTTAGWSVVKPSPLALRRADGMHPLPLPVHGANDALGELRALLGFDGEDHDQFWALYTGFMFGVLRPVPPYFVLVVDGEQGTGKTTTMKVLRVSVDPHETDIQPKPKTEDDLFCNADGQWLTVYDNLSTLDQHWSDAFCRISTGSGYSKRKLYTDRETTRFQVARPQAITSIIDVAAAPDLLDRSLLAAMPELESFRAEEELLAAAAALAPRVLGQLLDAAVVALRDQKSVELSRTPRMVGPTRWIEAGALVLGLDLEEFLDAYLDSQGRAGELALDASLIGVPIRDMIDRRDTLARLAAQEGKAYVGPIGFSGTAKDLLSDLNKHIQAEAHPGRGWPRTPRGMSGALRRIAPALRKLGYPVEFERVGHTHARIITIGSPQTKESKPFGYENNRPHRPHLRVRSHWVADGADGADGRNPTQTGKRQRARANGMGNGTTAPGVCAWCHKPIPAEAGFTATSADEHLHNACVDAWSKRES